VARGLPLLPVVSPEIDLMNQKIIRS
jgi:hypothetical protein